MRNRLRKVLTHAKGAIYAWWQFPHLDALSDEHSDLVFGCILKWAAKPAERCGRDPQKKYDCAGPNGTCKHIEPVRNHRHYLFGPLGWSGDAKRNSPEHDFIGFRIDLLKSPGPQFNSQDSKPVEFLAIAHEMAHERSRYCKEVAGKKRPKTVWGFEYEAERECLDIQRSENLNYRKLRRFWPLMVACLRIKSSSILGMSSPAKIIVGSAIIWLVTAAWKLGFVSEELEEIIRMAPSDFIDSWQLKNGIDFVCVALILFSALAFIRKSAWGVFQSINYLEDFICPD